MLDEKKNCVKRCMKLVFSIVHEFYYRSFLIMLVIECFAFGFSSIFIYFSFFSQFISVVVVFFAIPFCRAFAVTFVKMRFFYFSNSMIQWHFLEKRHVIYDSCNQKHLWKKKDWFSSACAKKSKRMCFN